MPLRTSIIFRKARRKPPNGRRAIGWSACLLLLAGCTGLNGLQLLRHDDALPDPYIQAATSIEYPNVDEPLDAAWTTPEPFTLTSGREPAYRDVSLEEVIHHALTNSKVLRDVGGLVLRSPRSVATVYDPALQETDPRFGVQAALSEFDAQLNSSALYQHNDRALNNVFFGGGTRDLRQRTALIQSGITKRTPYGSEFYLRNNEVFDANNSPGNQFSRAWDANFEAGFRQSLLRGAGLDVNRIAGTNPVPGVYNGVLLARTNTDVSLADFEIAVREFVSDVENAYWDLYFAYRDLDAKISARDLALETWRHVWSLKDRKGGESDKEAQAREQYYRFEEDVQNALTGRLVEPTRTHNGSNGGTFRNNGGVQVAERRLRYLINMPQNTGELLRPADEPIEAPIVFDWNQALSEALQRRPELRRQKWMIEQRELQLIAARNLLKPDLDVVGLYRWRGFGKSLLDPEGGGPPLDDAFTTLANGDYQEWQFGAELNFPIGNRRAHAGVRNAEFQLVREQALLREQEQRIVRDLSDAYADVDRAFGLVQTVYNRREAARDQVAALQTLFDANFAELNLLLDAQRRLALSESRYYEALVEYTLSIKNMHFEKGNLLEYEGIQLAEGPWSEAAHADAADRLERRLPARYGPFMPEQQVIVKPGR